MDLVKVVIFEIIFLIPWLLSYQTVHSTKNEVILERVVCHKTKPESFFQNLFCQVKYISRRHLKYHIHFNATRPISSLWIHGVLYYKFNGLVYNKFPLDLWEDVCKWMAEKIAGKGSYYNLMDWTFGFAVKHSTLNQSTCPIYGYHVFDIKNLSMSTFVFEPLIPSGSYRLNVDYTESDRVPFVSAQIFFSVSDHRIEKI